MLNELCLYFELLIYLAGTFLYLFLTRELLRRPQVLPGNWPLRGMLFVLTFWYGLTLVDELLAMLFAPVSDLGRVGVTIDATRGWAWLLTFPLLVHTLVALDQDAARSPRWLRVLPYPAYLWLAVFVPATIDFFRAGEPRLAAVSRVIFPQVAIYSVVLLVVAAGFVLRLSARVRDRRMAAFLRLLLGVFVVMGSLTVLGALNDPWAPEASGAERILRTLLMGGPLLPGGLFAYFVQRYNLLRLSLSHRTLRHFTAVLTLVVLVMLAGPALGLEGMSLFRRFVAWGLLLALFLGLAYQPLLDRVLRHSTALRRFLGKNVTPRDLDRLMVSLQRPDLDEREALERSAQELGQWLGAEAAFLPAPEEEGRYRPFWEHYASPEAPLVHRLAPATPQLALLLDRDELHAVFPLRVEERLEGLLGLSVSATGGGYDMAELEAVQLLIRQLAATLALRRLVAARVAEERRLAEHAEHERLRMLGLVAASLAHEVKNPLSSMKALAQALREDLASRGGDGLEDGVADLDLILEQVDRLDKTTREILGLARPRTGVATELTALVRSTLYVLRAEAKKRGVELADAGVDELGEVVGSETAWQTVVFNLMLNAVENTPAGGRAEVELHATKGGVVFLTRNPGDLSEEATGQMFEPFVSEGGTGLGLALVKRRVEELGGSVGVVCEDGEVVFRVAAVKA